MQGNQYSGYGSGYGAMGGGMNPQQTGFMQSQQTGYPGMQGGMQGGMGMNGGGMGMRSQPTGMPSSMRMQSQPTGMPSMGGMGMSSMNTGMGYGSSTPGGMQPMMTGMPQRQQPQQTGMSNLGGGYSGAGMGMSSNPTGANGPGNTNSNYSFLNAPPTPSALGGGTGARLTPQMTGYPGAGGMGALTAQATGMPHDPRLQMMAASFMPSNINQPLNASGNMQFAHPLSQPLQQSFQSLLSNPSVATPKVPWTLSRQEKKDYDQIFRAWTGGEGGGFIEGDMAREVFGQSGLGREDLMKIWNLADINNRGKLNLPEFHVAMGLIYRALNGNQIPDTLPAELIPPSMRDIDSTVDFVKDLLRNDNSSRNTPDINLPGSYAKQANDRDATNYKHDDTRSTGYKSSARHLDRRQVRYEGEDPSSELSSLKRDLENSSAVLDRSADQFAKRTEEDEQLEQELDDLKYRVRRVKDDIEYVSRGKRTSERDEERRKLERELMYLMHERLPEVEKKIEEREERKRQEVREGIRARDKRNESYGRYDRYESGRRSSFDRDRERYRDDDRRYDSRDRERDGRDSRDRSRDRYESYSSRRPLSPPPRERTPPPVPAEQPKSAITVPPPAPPAPTSTKTSAPSTKNMSPEERAAFIRAQAQERLQARMRALGMAVPEGESSAPTVDKSVEERLEREKKEAEEKVKQAEKEQEERTAARQARLQQASGANTPAESVKPATPSVPIKSAMKKAPAPPPPKSRTALSAAAVPSPKPAASPAPPPSAAAPKQSQEDEELRAQEEAHRKALEERRARIQRMREEEEEAQRAEEEMLKRRQQQAAARKVESPAPVATPVTLAEPEPVPRAPSPVKSMSSSNASTNPFHRLQNNASASPSAPQPQKITGFNPFFRPPPQSAPSPKAEEPVASQSEDEGAPPPPPPPPPPAASAPVATPAPASKAPVGAPPVDEEWDVINEKGNDSGDSSDDDDYAGSRSMRDNLARALFGGGGSKPTSKPASPAPAVNKASLAKLGGGDPSNIGALFSAIQGGARLKHTVTNDRSAAPISGRVIGDAAPPAHISETPREQVATQMPSSSATQDTTDDTAPERSANRQSVDWYAGLAADADRSVAEPSGMSSVAEAEEPHPESLVTAPAEKHAEEDPTGEFDMQTTLRVRSLYPYDGQRDVDLSFKENMVLMAHPAKDPQSPWWYGMLLQGGKSGWFPNSYVQEIRVQHAKALFPYTGNSDEELPFSEGDILNIVDSSEEDWWKAEKNGVIFIVPAAYLELKGADSNASKMVATPEPSDSPANNDVNPGHAKVNGSYQDNHYSDAASDTSEDSILSFDDTETEEVQGVAQNDKERGRKEQERMRIMESAGLHLKQEPARAPPTRAKRRPPPATPVSKRLSTISGQSDTTNLAVPPSRPNHDRTPSRNSVTSLGPDAYDRYEAYLAKAKNTPMNRTRSQSDVRPPSMAAIDKVAPMQIGSPSSSTFTLGSFSKESKLAGFMNKLSTPATPERKSTASISGPINIVRLDESQEDVPSHQLGPTWSSLVDSELLANLDEKERKRQEAMFEFITTEGAYVRDLQLVVEFFYAPMLSMLEETVTSGIFSNLEDILLFNTGLLSSLEDRQRSCRLYIDRIGDILSTRLPNVYIYKEYCMNQSQAISRLQTLREQDSKIAAHLQTVRDENVSVRHLDLSSFLLEPMQRLTRYPLLIRQIMKYGEEADELVQLDTALMSTERVLEEVNESVRQAENLERLRVLSEDLWIGGEGRLDLTQNTAYLGPRRLLKEGSVSKAKSGRKLQLVLCNDIVVLLESRSLYRMPIPLHEAQAKEGSTRDGTAFTIIQDYKRHGDTIALKASSTKEAQTWIQLINQARESAVRAREAWARGNRRRSGIGY